jgi:Ca2+-transporting ATPase
MRSSKDGLTQSEAESRLKAQGPNQLREKPRPPAWRRFLDQFRSLLILVLLVAALLAGLIGELRDALVILVVMVINALLGYLQENRAEQALAALKQMLPNKARVRRACQVQELSAENLVVGDILLLSPGDRVAADGRVLLAHEAEVAEASLTGESVSVTKEAVCLVDAQQPLAERHNMVFMNTLVTKGRMEVLVTATGMATEMGRITSLLDAAEQPQTPLQIQLDGLGKRLSIIALLVIALILVMGLLRGDALMQSLLTAIALAVAAIPEGLPAVVTLTLAIGMQRMARHKAILKTLAAVETLGATSVICSDKTGTLTLNQMSVQRILVQGQSLSQDELLQAHPASPLLEAAVLCNNSHIDHGQLIGAPTETALYDLGLKAGLHPDELHQQQPRLAEIPFASAQRFMASLHRDGDAYRILVKGAPEVLLARSSGWLAQAGIQPLDEAAKARFEHENEQMAGDAMRVLALAERRIPAQGFDLDTPLETLLDGLCLLGLVGIQDPPRPEAKEAIRLCKAAGIQVKMITGDHPLTAKAIARQLGIQGSILTGAELDALSPEALAGRIQGCAVFARVSPEHKVKIVQALQIQGQRVAMTGDGVNDAPALKTADIGIAMGRSGTQVTREAADMVLSDDNFATIVGAVREGRTLYENIIKFLRFQLATNIGAIFSVMGAQIMGLPIPFSALQILWINIIMDGPPAMTLGLEPSRPGIMQEPPRAPGTPILTLKRLIHLWAHGAIMATGTLAVFFYAMLSLDVARAHTLAFTTFVLFQVFNAFNARAEHQSVLNSQLFSNAKLWLALAAVVSLQILVVHWAPAQAIFHTQALSPLDWALAWGTASSVLLLDEARKRLFRPRSSCACGT